MMINFPQLGEPISISKGTILVIEDIPLFSKIVQNLFSYEIGGEISLFNKKYEAIKANELVFISDILSFDGNSTSIQKLIYSDLENQINQKIELECSIENIINQLTMLIEEEMLNHELPLSNCEICIKDVFKILEIKINLAEKTIFEKCLMVIEIFNYLPKKKILIFNNLTSYLSANELNELIEHIELNDVSCLILESRKTLCENQFVLDEDYFLLKPCML